MSGDRSNVCRLFDRGAQKAHQVYNLFRRHDEPELYCAVAEHNPVPGFVTADAWEFAGTCRARDEFPPGFVAEAASLGVGLNGFYLFMSYARRRTAGRPCARTGDVAAPSVESA